VTLRALPVQLIETADRVLLKRGRVEIAVGGEGVADVVKTIFTAASGEGATTEEIVSLFAATDRPAVERLVEHLAQRRLLVPAEAEGAPTADPAAAETPADVFYWHFGDTGEAVASRLDELRAVVLGVNVVSSRLVAALSQAGATRFQVVDEPLLRNLRMISDEGDLIDDHWPAALEPPLAYETWKRTFDPSALDCVVATSDFGGAVLMRQWNEFAVEHRHAFFPVVLQDLIGYIGPLVVPGETACYECLRGRQNANFEDPASRRAAESSAYAGQAVAGAHPIMASVLGELAAFELIKLYGLRRPLWRPGTLVEVGFLASRTTSRTVLKLPRCPVCGPLRSTSPISPWRELRSST
jgi:bacteriocin biosynthesis cyclodehydratase domain-containing protein